MTGGKKKGTSSLSSPSPSKKFTCPTCGYITFLKARFTKHVKYHSMPFVKCEFCDFKSQYSWNLDRHMKNHNTMGEISCPLCNFSCDMKQSLTSHLQNHHNNVPEHIMAQYRSGSSTSSNKNADKSPGGGSRRESLELEQGPTSSSSDTQLFKQEQDDDDDDIKVLRLTKKFYKCRYCSFNALSELGLNKHIMQTHQEDGGSEININPCKSAASTNVNVIVKPMPNLIPIPTSSISISQPSQQNRHHNDDDDPKKIEFLKNLGLSPKTLEGVQKPLSRTPVVFQRRTSFFDKLSKKLTSSPAVLSQQQQAMKMKSSSITDTSNKSKSTISSTRCQYCRHRCKTSADLIQHLRGCEEVPNLLIQDEDSYDRLIQIQRSQERNNKEDVQDYDDDEDGSSPIQYFHNFDGFSGLQQLQVDTTITNDKDDSYDEPSPAATVDSSMETDVLSSTESSGSGAHITKKSRKVYKCPENDCEFWATTASRFHVHIVGHYNTKPFECSQCSYRSNWRWDITKHIRLKTIRDPSHSKAKALLKHKSGERNYRKYDRYLVPMELSYSADSKLPDCSTVASKRPDVELIPNLSPAPSSVSSGRSMKPTVNAKMPKLIKAPTTSSFSSTTSTSSLSRDNFHLRQALTAGPSLFKVNMEPPNLKVSPTSTRTGKIFVEKKIMAGGEFIVQNNPNSLLKSSLQPHPQHGNPTPTPLFLCEECPARFLYDKELRIHHTFHEKPSQFHCGLCSYSARQEFPHLMTHRKVHTLDYQEKTEQMLQGGKFVMAPKLSRNNPNKTKGRMISYPTLTITRSKLFQDSSPEEEAYDLSSSAGSSDPYSSSCLIPCPNCPAKFNTIPTFLQHAHNHGKETPYLCQFCDYGADSKNNLTLHSVLHFGSEITIEPEVDLEEEDYDDGMEDMFIPTVILPEDDDEVVQQESSNLFINATAYKGNPEFNYPTYVKNGRIKSKRYKCLKCPSAFEKRDQYRVHTGLHGSDQRYKCMVCDYSVTYYANFIQHLKKHENQPNVSKEQLVATPLSKIRKDNNNTLRMMQRMNTNKKEQKVPPLVLKVPNAR